MEAAKTGKISRLLSRTPAPSVRATRAERAAGCLQAPGVRRARGGPPGFFGAWWPPRPYVHGAAAGGRWAGRQPAMHLRRLVCVSMRRGGDSMRGGGPPIHALPGCHSFRTSRETHRQAAVRYSCLTRWWRNLLEAEGGPVLAALAAESKDARAGVTWDHGVRAGKAGPAPGNVAGRTAFFSVAFGPSARPNPFITLFFVRGSAAPGSVHCCCSSKPQSRLGCSFDVENNAHIIVDVNV
jgi:hypothetical protein